MSTTVVIPTFNPGVDLRAQLDALAAQKPVGPEEILVIDSGSSDGTLEELRRRPVRMIEIAKGSFNHGLTRALGVLEARSEVVAFLTQDAIPADSSWLRSLVDCFADPAVAGAYSRQVPRPDAPPFSRFRLEGYAATALDRREQRIESEEAFSRLTPFERLSRIGFDNVSSAVRRDVALKIPFREADFGEDLDWSRRALLAGYTIVYEPRSVVVHSHDRSLWYEFKRVYHDHQGLRRSLGLVAFPTAPKALLGAARLVPKVIRYVADDPRLDGAARLRWVAKVIPFAVSQTFAQYFGARSAEPGHGGLVGRALSTVIGRSL